MANKKFVKRKSTGARVAQGIIVMTLLTTLSIGVFSYYIYRKDAMEQHAKTAENLALSISAAIDADEFLESVAKETEDEYWEGVKLFLDTLKTQTDVEYMYILTHEGNGVFRYYCEGIRPADDPEDIGEFGYVEYNTEVFGIEAVYAMEQKTPQISDAYYSDGYGYLVSGFAPVFDENNNSIGVVGVDINVVDVQEAANRFALYIAVAGLIFGAVFAYISKRYVQHLISNAIGRISGGTEDLANGVLTFETRDDDANDDIGRLYGNFAKVVGTFKMLINDMKNMSDMHSQGEFETRLDESKYSGAYLEVVKGVNEMTFMYVDNFKELLSVVQSYGNGNFEADVRKYPGKLAVGNEIVDELRSHLKDVNDEIMNLAQVALSGDLSARANSAKFKGDWTKIMLNLNNLIEAIVVPIQEAAEVLHKMAEGNLSVKMQGEYKGDFSLIKDNLNDTINELSFYIHEIGRVLRAISQNDLTVGVSRSFVGDFASIEHEIGSIITAQDKFFREVGQVAEQLSASAEQVADSGGKMSQGATEQHDTIAQLTQSITTVNDQTHENAKNAEEADKISATSMVNATSGSKEMENMLKSMESIKASSNNIASIMKVIDEIAFQTNLLALNAAVEAARAGEHGKGFAVVAEEVRSLATRSLQAAQQTQELIDDTISRVNGGAETAQSTAGALAKICDNVSAVSSLITKISHSSKEQAGAVEFIKEGIEHISTIVETNADMAKENEAASDDLSNEAESLNKLFGSVKLK